MACVVTFFSWTRATFPPPRMDSTVPAVLTRADLAATPSPILPPDVPGERVRSMELCREPLRKMLLCLHTVLLPRRPYPPHCFCLLTPECLALRAEGNRGVLPARDAELPCLPHTTSTPLCAVVTHSFLFPNMDLTASRASGYCSATSVVPMGG